VQLALSGYQRGWSRSELVAGYFLSPTVGWTSSCRFIRTSDSYSTNEGVQRTFGAQVPFVPRQWSDWSRAVSALAPVFYSSISNYVTYVLQNVIRAICTRFYIRFLCNHHSRMDRSVAVRLGCLSGTSHHRMWEGNSLVRRVTQQEVTFWHQNLVPVYFICADRHQCVQISQCDAVTYSPPPPMCLIQRNVACLN
jgi:hypothetical protein